MEYRTISGHESGFPRLLKETQSPPRDIFVRGVLPGEEGKWIAIVGTRKATPRGMRLAAETARALAERGAVIVSGLAMGIDTAAHRGALLGRGTTVAVLGSGIDTIYPAQNEGLGQEICRSGAVISEYAPGIPALPYRFLERNRIVAGLSHAVLVIEAPEKSGALVTARLAAEAGREVFVFPGEAGNPQYRGSHKLIRDGARLVNSVEDVIEDLSASFSAQHIPQLFDLEISSGANPILDVISKSKTFLQVDKIIELTKLDAQAVNREITNLVMHGILIEEGTGYKLAA